MALFFEVIGDVLQGKLLPALFISHDAQHSVFEYHHPLLLTEPVSWVMTRNQIQIDLFVFLVQFVDVENNPGVIFVVIFKYTVKIFDRKNQHCCAH